MLDKVDSSVVRQPNERRHRRWWHSPEGDLIIDWDRKSGDLVYFEIDWESCGEHRCYVRWGRGVGLSTGVVDTGDNRGALEYKASPVIYFDEELSRDRVRGARAFLSASGISQNIWREIADHLYTGGVNN